MKHYMKRFISATAMIKLLLITSITAAHPGKVNTGYEQELASVFGIKSIPTLLFIPGEGQPQAAMGALPRQTFEKVIKDVLLQN